MSYIGMHVATKEHIDIVQLYSISTSFHPHVGIFILGVSRPALRGRTFTFFSSRLRLKLWNRFLQNEDIPNSKFREFLQGFFGVL